MNGANPVSLPKRCRYAVEILALRTATALVRLLPWTAVWRLGQWLGGLAYYTGGEMRRVALANLEIAFGNTKSAAEKRRIARASFRNLGSTLLGLLWSPRLTRDLVERTVMVDPAEWQRLQQQLGGGRGVIFVTLHYGNWELLGLATGLFGINSVVLMEAMRNQALEETINSLRAATGHQLLPHRQAATKLLRALKRGQSIALLIDLNGRGGGGGLWLEFFGLPVFTNSAFATLSLLTGVPIVPAVSRPLGNGRYAFHYGAPIPPEPTGDHAADVRRLTLQCLAFCEAEIRRAPEHWLWSYKRWKYRPHPDQGPYPHYSKFDEAKLEP